MNASSGLSPGPGSGVHSSDRKDGLNVSIRLFTIESGILFKKDLKPVVLHHHYRVSVECIFPTIDRCYHLHCNLEVKNGVFVVRRANPTLCTL